MSDPLPPDHPALNPDRTKGPAKPLTTTPPPAPPASGASAVQEQA